MHVVMLTTRLSQLLPCKISKYHCAKTVASQRTVAQRPYHCANTLHKISLHLNVVCENSSTISVTVPAFTNAISNRVLNVKNKDNLIIFYVSYLCSPHEVNTFISPPRSNMCKPPRTGLVQSSMYKKRQRCSSRIIVPLLIWATILTHGSR